MPIVEHEYLKALDLADEWRISAQPHIEDPGVNSPSNDFWRLTEDLVTWCYLHHIDGGILWEVYRQIVACRRPDPDGYIGPRQSHATMQANYRKALDLLCRVQNLAMKHKVNRSKDSGLKPKDKIPEETEQKEIVEVKPGLFGITVNIKEIARRFWKRVCSRSKD